MSFTRKSILQIKDLISVLATSYAIIIFLLFSVAMVSAHYDIQISRFTRDPSAIFNGHPFVGVISNIGILFWCSTSAICLFVSAINLKRKNKEAAIFLLFSGLITLFLLLDDMLMFHEFMIPKYLNVSETTVYVAYLILIAMYFVKFGNLILKAEYMVLFVACVFFALSITSDVFLPQKGMGFLVEDGAKLFGIVTWFIFFVRTCFSQALQEMETPVKSEGFIHRGVAFPE